MGKGKRFLAWFLAAALTVTSVNIGTPASVKAEVTDANLVAGYTFDSTIDATTKVDDDTIQTSIVGAGVSESTAEAAYTTGHDGTENGAVQLGDYGLKLNRTNIGTSYTVSFWVKRDGSKYLSNDQNKMVLLMLGDNTSQAVTVDQYWGGPDIRARKIDGGDGGNSIITQYKEFTASVWHMLTVSQTGTQTDIYVDGKQIALNAENSVEPLNGEAQDIILGVSYAKGNTANAYVYPAAIDDLVVYNSNMTSAEVAKLYLQQATEAERLAYLGMDETCVKELPSEKNGLAITWSSSDGEAVVDGKLMEVPDGRTVTLTASADGEKLFDQEVTLATSVTLKRIVPGTDGAADTELETKVIEKGAQKLGGSYTYATVGEDAVYVSEGIVYVLDSENSTLKVDSLKTTEENVVTLAYKQDAIASVATLETIYTIEGNSPLMPATVEVTTEGGTTIDTAVVWEDTDNLEVGNHTITGSVAGYDGDVTVDVCVYACDGAGIEEAEIEKNQNRPYYAFAGNKQYGGEVVISFDITPQGTEDIPVLYRDKTSETKDDQYGMSRIDLRFNGKNAAYEIKVRNDANDGHEVLGYYTNGKTYRVWITADTAKKTYNIKVYDVKTAEIVAEKENAIYRNQESVNGLTGYTVDNTTRGAYITNHKIFWQSGYAKKNVNIYVDGEKVVSETYKEMPASNHTYTPEAEYTYEDKTYFIDEETSGWVDGKNTTTAANDEITYNVYYVASANFDVLETAINEADADYQAAVKAKVYTEESLKVWEDALAAAKAVLATKDTEDEADATEITEATNTLKTAIETNPLVAADLETVNEKALTAWYPLTDDAKDVTGNGYDGTAKGVTFDREDGAKFTYAKDVKLGSYISLPTDMFLESENLTVSFWAKDISTQESQAVFGFGSGYYDLRDTTNDANTYKYVLINTNKGRNLKTVITRNSWAGETGFKGDAASGNISYPENTWAHITCVFEGTKMAVYKDAVLAGTVDTGIKVTELGTTQDARIAYIGNSIWGTNDPDYNGNVKDFRVYDAPLKDSQVKEIYDYMGTLPMKYAKEDVLTKVKEAIGTDNVVVAEDGTVTLNISEEAVTLPTTGVQGETITWASANENIAVTDGTATVTLPKDTATVVEGNLTATITIGEEVDTVIFATKVFTKNNTNVTALQQAVADAEKNGYVAEDYTVATWTAYANALAAAKQNIAQPPATEDEVAALVKALTEADKALVKVTDLKAAIADAKALTEADYTEASWTAVEAALEAAEEVVADAQATQKAVDDALAALAEAVGKLVTLAEQEIIEAKDDLTAAIEEKTADLVEADYTKASWEALQAALEAAEEVINSKDATTEDIEAAKAAVEDAVAALKLQTEADEEAALETAKTELAAEITVADDYVATLKETDYTAESLKAVKDAIAAAKALADKEDVTAEELTTAKDSITKEAIDKVLVKVTSSTPSTPTTPQTPAEPEKPAVTDVKVSSIKITNKNVKIAAGKKVALVAEVGPENATNSDVEWSIAAKDAKYASVNAAGVVTTKKKGAGKKVTVTATAKDGSGVKATVKVQIMKHAVKSIKLKAAKKQVVAGKKVKIKTTVKTTGKKVNKTLAWTSSNDNWATVSSKGVVSTKKAGKGKTVTITATSTDGTNKKAKVKIKIK
ncbi:MAG: FIVAR domain-containing protein [Lachnospiraceae bacterium]|nr:FIVAR domain-containing protein [Lachnospiraceae bacterium]